MEYKIFEKLCLTQYKEQITDENAEEFTDSKVKMAVFDVIKYAIRNRTLDEGARVDNRNMTDIRPLFTQVDTVSRNH